MDAREHSPLSSLLRAPADTPDGLETDRLRAAARSALFGQDWDDGNVRVGRFIVGAWIGQGAMGTVFRAHDPDLGRDVALKALEPVEGGQEVIEVLLGEARTLAQLNHPNVVTVHECGVDRGHVYIAMELVEGGTLSDWLRRNPPGEARRFERALHLATQAAAGLAAAHAVGLIHRDLKPANMLVDAEDRLRIADFGLARTTEYAAAQDALTQESNEPTPPWTTPAGTPGYVAPEQLEGKPTNASDQFSLCATLYEVFAGTQPFQGRTAQERIASIRARRFQPAAASFSVPRWLRRVLERGLEAPPENRFESVQALLAALERGRERPPRPRALLLGGAGVAAVAGALSIPALAGEQHKAPPSATPCTNGAESLARVWGPARAEITRAEVMEVEGPYSSEAWSRISEGLEAWGTQWVGEYEDACAATKVRGQQPEATMELKMRCLDRQLIVVDATLERVGEMSLPAIVTSLADGPRPIECRDSAQLEATLQEPKDPKSRTEIDTILRSVQIAELALLDAKPKAGLAATTAAVEHARTLAHGPSLVEALVLHSKLLLANRKPFESAAREAVQLAAQHNLPASETNAWLMVSRGADDHADIIKRDSDTSISLEAAQASLLRAGRPAQLTARVTKRRAEVAHYVHRDLERGLELYAEALELFRAAPRPPLGEVGELVDSYADALALLARHDEAVELCRWRLEYAQSRRGPRHPQTGRAYLRLANALSTGGEYEEAELEAQRAFEILLEARVPELDLAKPIGLLGSLAMSREDWATARVHIERTLDIHVKEYGWQGITAAPLKLLGELELRSGNPELAKAHFERALEMTTESFGPDTPWTEWLREDLGDASLALGEFEEAAAWFELVIGRLETIHGQESEVLVPVMTKHAQAQRGLGNPDGAREPLAATNATKATKAIADGGAEMSDDARAELRRGL